MGAHTLGKARPDRSGFRGPWLSVGAVNFDHEFYKALKNNTLFWNKQVSNYLAVPLNAHPNQIW